MSFIMVVWNGTGSRPVILYPIIFISTARIISAQCVILSVVVCGGEPNAIKVKVNLQNNVCDKASVI